MIERQPGVVFVNNTRFNPTVNGRLHLGHLYLALVNQTEARRTGGKFGVRLDDTQRYWNWYCGLAVDGYACEMRKDLEYFGIKPDYWISQAEQMPEVVHLMEREFHYNAGIQPFTPDQAAEVVGFSNQFYPYTELLTAEKVIFDFIEHVTYVIRGFDLITEDCLYRYFIDRFKLARVRMAYIPRLLFDNDCVSKTIGNYKLCDFRNIGADPEEVVSYLAYDCLRDPTCWRVDNIKANPVLGEWAKGMLHGVH